jgi:hypothetical protein
MRPIPWRLPRTHLAPAAVGGPLGEPQQQHASRSAASYRVGHSPGEEGLISDHSYLRRGRPLQAQKTPRKGEFNSTLQRMEVTIDG